MGEGGEAVGEGGPLVVKEAAAGAVHHHHEGVVAAVAEVLGEEAVEVGHDALLSGGQQGHVEFAELGEDGCCWLVRVAVHGAGFGDVFFEAGGYGPEVLAVEVVELLDQVGDDVVASACYEAVDLDAGLAPVLEGKVVVSPLCCG